MITYSDPLRGLMFYWDLGFSHTLHILKERRRRRDRSVMGRLVTWAGCPLTSVNLGRLVTSLRLPRFTEVK